MTAERLLVCTDLDRTLIPNGPQPESPGARRRFASLAARPEVTLAYVSGRHRELVEKAISHYRLPRPDFVVGDVGTTIYEVSGADTWRERQGWADAISRDWKGLERDRVAELLRGLPELRLQESEKQNRCKLSYYLPRESDLGELERRIEARLAVAGVQARLVYSVDEPAGVGLLDVLPRSASKLHALEALMDEEGFEPGQAVFCGDSGNDLEVLASRIPSVLVANAPANVRREALDRAEANGCADALYLAQGGFHGMNGNYSAGMLEGIAHFHPLSLAWMGLSDRESA